MYEDKLGRIRAICFDVDGVLTDGRILAVDNGELYRQFDAKDAFAMRMAASNGYILGCITGGRSLSIRQRMAICGVEDEDIYLHSHRKILDFNDFCLRHGLSADQVMYIGDDIPDIPVLQACGFSVAPADACEEVREIVDFVTPEGGGRQCMRHALKMVLAFQGRWGLEHGNYFERNF